MRIIHGRNSKAYERISWEQAFETSIRRQWLKELGVKVVFIAPYFNNTAAIYNDKWFAPRVGTDTAMAHTIAYVWLTEDLYDKRNSFDDFFFAYEIDRSQLMGIL